MIIKNSDAKVYRDKCEVLNTFGLTTQENQQYLKNLQKASRENADSLRRMIWFMPDTGNKFNSRGWKNLIKGNLIIEECERGADKFKSRMDMQERIVFYSKDGNHDLKFLGIYKPIELKGLTRTYELVSDTYTIESGYNL